MKVDEFGQGRILANDFSFLRQWRIRLSEGVLKTHGPLDLRSCEGLLTIDFSSSRLNPVLKIKHSGGKTNEIGSSAVDESG